MKKYSAVIGSLWGDEGKGHMTDILCDTSNNTLNIRFNGGAQASHTVVTTDGKRYAFRHVGAGTFTDADTYLSADFIVNPMLYEKESAEIWEKFGIVVQEYVNLNCIVTTPWDMYINQVLEITRGEERHGSCGMGINETVARCKNFRYRIIIADLFEEESLYLKLKKIEEQYVPSRLEYYGLTIEQMPEEYKRMFLDTDTIDMFIFYCREFLKHVKIANDDIIEDYDNIVFEGAQGLLLDQNSQFKPYVTHSNTGIKNVMKILNNMNFEDNIDIYYMCRCYATKHGAGNFPGEADVREYANVIDETNIPNDFQGSLRLGILDFDLLADTINNDLSNLIVAANINVCITCLDQISGYICYIENGEQKSVTKEEFISDFKTYMKEKLNFFDNLYITNGMTRENFSRV